MMADKNYINKINAEDFQDIALTIFKNQYKSNTIYRAYIDAIKVVPGDVNNLLSVPFLPISFFKTHPVICGIHIPELYFESSGTTGEISSRHYITDIGIYEDSLLKGFNEFYGAAEDYAVLALLPSYLERGNASLVYMAKLLMDKSGHEENGFYLNEWERLRDVLSQLEKKGQKTILIGVTFALLDFADQYPLSLKHTVVMETGGMKGRKKEMTRPEVHEYLTDRWELDRVHSEYGMTELLSQAYAQNDGIFYPTSTMKVFIRDMNDPFEVKTSGVGYLNIADLANIHSCSFIATEDIGKLNEDGSFEVLGRMDHSALRGCSLMTA
jgi:phenylacetate-coenzyme A ligase PaaK-like adenylate-forming protein